MRMSLLSSSAAALALSACAVGPNYVRPATPISGSGAFVTQPPGPVISNLAAVDEWWHLYQDPVLDGLVADALLANTEVRVSVARLERARASLRETNAGRLPSSNIQASAERQRNSAIQTLPGLDRENTVVDGGISVAYEVDLFGRVKRGVEAARGDVGAAQADLDAVRVSVVADTTRAYVDAAGTAQRLAVAEHIVALLDRSLRVTSGRERVGLATSLDTARIATLREQRQAEVPTLVAERQAALFRLAVLTGRTPGELPPAAGARTAPPRILQPIPVGDGAALLARRPDVHAAEQRLAAATARIGVATADLYPKVSLGGAIGSTGFGFGDLFGAGTLRWLAGPLISWSFPNQVRIRARIGEAKADSQAALATFDGSMLQALGETDTALSNYARALDRRISLQAAQDHAERAVRIVRAQQREGQVDSLSLLDAERTFADAEAQLAENDAGIANRQVDLFRALGGGWQRGSAQSVENEARR